MSKKTRVSQNSSTPLLSLPRDILLEVLQWLDWKTHLITMMTTRDLQRLCKLPLSRCPNLTFPPLNRKLRLSTANLVSRILKQVEKNPSFLADRLVSNRHLFLHVPVLKCLTRECILQLPASLNSLHLEPDTIEDYQGDGTYLKHLVEDLFPRLTKLKTLTLFDYQRSATAYSLEEFSLQSLLGCTDTLKEFRFIVRGIFFNPACFGFFPHLQIVHLRYYDGNVTIPQTELLKKHLLVLPALEELTLEFDFWITLKLEDCIVTPSPVSTSNFVIAPLKKLHVLSCWVCPCEAFLLQFPKLQNLNLRNCTASSQLFLSSDSLLGQLQILKVGVDAITAEFLKDQLPKMVKLKKLSVVPSGTLQELPIECLFSLAKLPALEMLSLPRAFASAIWPPGNLCFRNLKILDISWCKLHVSCAPKFLHWLEGHPNIERVYLLEAFQNQKEVEYMVKQRVGPFLGRICDFKTENEL